MNMDTAKEKIPANNVKPHIFVIEDNPDIGFILEYYLNEEGFEVKLFPTALSFQRAFKHEMPDIILLDVMLPDGNGLELCEQIKLNPKTSSLPVLIMSAHASIADSEDCPAEEFIPKPFDLSYLVKKIRKYLPAA